MKKIGKLLALVLLLASCSLGTVQYSEFDIIGRWEAPSKNNDSDIANPKIVFVFSNETCIVVTDSSYSDKDGSFKPIETNYGKWGYTFDEGEDVTEDDLLNTDADGSYHKNGWFGWTLDGKNIVTYQLTSVGNAVVPETYIIQSLTGNTMVLKEGQSSIAPVHQLTKVN